MSRSNSALWFNDRAQTGVLTIRDRRERVRQQEDQEDINEVFAKETRDHEDSVRTRSVQA